MGLDVGREQQLIEIIYSVCLSSSPSCANMEKIANISDI